MLSDCRYEAGIAAVYKSVLSALKIATRAADGGTGEQAMNTAEQTGVVSTFVMCRDR